MNCRELCRRILDHSIPRRKRWIEKNRISLTLYKKNKSRKDNKKFDGKCLKKKLMDPL